MKFRIALDIIAHKRALRPDDLPTNPGVFQSCPYKLPTDSLIPKGFGYFGMCDCNLVPAAGVLCYGQRTAEIRLESALVFVIDDSEFVQIDRSHVPVMTL